MLWGRARRILDPGFTQAALRTYHQAMQSVADDMLASFPEHGRVDIHQLMTNATLEVIARAGFSRNLGLFSESSDPQVTDLIDTLNGVLSWASESSNDIPGLGHVRGAIQRRRLEGGLQRARQYVDQIVADRADGSEASDNNDLLALMLAATDPETGEALPHENIRDQVLTFLVAGHETTAALLETTLWYLARDRQLVAQIRAEATERGFGYDGVAGMRVTRRVLNESLRLWPPVPGYFRVSRTDQQLGGYNIPAGHSVFVHVLAAQRDRQAWGPDAGTFDPGRLDAKELRRYPDRFFVPFGTGPRSCIGRAFAMQESALLISRIVSAYDLDLEVSASVTDPDMLERGTLRPTPYHCSVTAVRT
ncbi:cytochrome P450 [Gordonia phosphorivorans]|uniref:Cytochrome P450 n=1 Tax=Gordonia phosphorivorans TaxID=1056982 RepID=A0ABV6H8I0_9ACTN